MPGDQLLVELIPLRASGSERDQTRLDFASYWTVQGDGTSSERGS